MFPFLQIQKEFLNVHSEEHSKIFSKIFQRSFLVFSRGLTEFLTENKSIGLDDKSPLSDLRRNPPEVRVTSEQKPSNKIIYIVLQTSVRLF